MCNVVLAVIIIISLLLFIIMLYSRMKYRFEVNNYFGKYNNTGRNYNQEFDIGFPYKLTLDSSVYESSTGPIYMKKNSYYGQGGPYQDVKLTVDYECSDEHDKRHGRSLLADLY